MLATQKFDIEWKNHTNVNDVELRGAYQFEVSNSAKLRKDIDGTGNIEWAWQNVRENLKKSVKQSLGHYERKQHMSWADEDSLKFVDLRNQLILQWLQELRKINPDHLAKVRGKSSRH